MNSYILWNPSYSVGNPVVDQQHRTIIRLINELFNQLEEGNVHRTDAIVAAISRYTRVHFTFEENLLKNSGYPDLEAHLELHRKMVEQTALLKAAPPQEKETARKLLLFLKGWWIDHIVRQDSGYTPFIG